MNIDSRYAQRTLRNIAFLFCAITLFAPLALSNPRVELRPVNNGLYRPIDAPMIAGAVITGNKISLAQGGVNVEMELLASDWGTSNCASEGGGPCTLGAVQGTIDSTGYLGLNASPAQPGVDLNPLGNPGNRAQGAFIVTSVCAISLRDCTPPQPVCAGPEGSCVPNDRWVVAGFSPIPALATSTLNYEYLAANGTPTGVPNVPAADAQNNGYFGSLIVQVPAAAATTYTVSFVNDTNFTYFNDEVGLLIPDPVLIPGQIQIITGTCCTNLGPGGFCTDQVTNAQCNQIPTTNVHVFRPGETCLQEGCCSCVSDVACGDGNSCTQDECEDACHCVNTPNYNPQSQCCNPANGGTTLISDNNPCTSDACNSTTGQVTHTPVGSGPCDDGNSCTLNDACIGATCIGSTASTVPCSSDADCGTPAFCNLSTGFCGCNDLCPTDPDKNFPGICGCGVPDVGDGDGDGTLDCVDACPDDPAKSAPGVCGCGVPDVGDADADGTLNCVDVCPTLNDDIFAPDCVPPIPTMGGWGLIVVALTLLVGGKLWFGVRRTIPN